MVGQKETKCILSDKNETAEQGFLPALSFYSLQYSYSMSSTSQLPLK
jgi:hypothetical protein